MARLSVLPQSLLLLVASYAHAQSRRIRMVFGMHGVSAAAIAVAFALPPSTTARAATIVVNSLADPGEAGICALRDAITAANTMTATNGCAAGTGYDRIQFSVTGTILLASTLPQVTDSLLMINGPSSPGITIDGGGNVQVMQVAAGSILNLKNLTIAHGFTESNGGGIYNEGTLTVIDSTFSGNSTSSVFLNGGDGGGIYNEGTLTVINSTFSDNSTLPAFNNGDGGGVYNNRTATITNSTFSGNTAVGGTGIYNEGTLTVTKSTFSDNDTFGGPGGGIDNEGTLTVTKSTFSGNVDGSNCCGGGGIYNGGTLTVSDSTFSGNFGSNGGGIANNGEELSNNVTLTVSNSTFDGNTAAVPGGGRGGGISNFGALTITNSTFSGNLASSSSGGVGGGIYNKGTLVVTFSTFDGNTAGTMTAAAGSGIYNAGESSLKNTIVAGSNGVFGSPGANCTGTITDAGYNISDDKSCGFTATGSRNNTNPELSSDGLTNNGGPTQTIALDPGSPAIDVIPLADCTDQASPPNPIITDQRGALRPDVGEVYCDIGAYEYQDLAGQQSCNVKSLFALAHQFGNIEAAVSALGFPNMGALLKAIAISCGG